MDSPLIDLTQVEDLPVAAAAARPDAKGDDKLIVNHGEESLGSGAGPHTHSSDEEIKKEKKWKGICWPWSKKHDPPPKVRVGGKPTAADKKEDADQDGRRGCPDYFGVRSYLHNFYESHTLKDPDVYEEADDMRQLLNPLRHHHRRCTAAWWKAFVFVGVLFLLIGIACVLIGYLLPQKPILVGMAGADKEVIDRQAIIYNYYLDACKLVGLVLFCLGGLTLAVALMIPSFLYRYCDDERQEVMFSVGGNDGSPLLTKDPLKMSVPATEKLIEIQPTRRIDESSVIRESPIPAHLAGSQ